VQTKEMARSVLAAPPVAAVLHRVGSSPHLPERARAKLYFKVTKKIPPNPDRIFTHQVAGGEAIRLHLDGTVRRLYWTGSYEADALPLFAEYAAQSSTILDVGAAEGVYSLFAAARSPEALILAFEPGGPQLERLGANLASNDPKLSGRIQVVAKALADRSGTTEFYELPGGTSSLNSEFRSSTVTRTVEVARGDDVVAELIPDRTVDLVKLDTESTEPAALRGLDGTVKRDRPVIFCEVLAGRTEPELQPLVDEWGYRTYWLSDDGPVARDRIVGVKSNVNWLFLPDDRAPLQARSA
jgi:FkbM family methyltransferase